MKHERKSIQVQPFELIVVFILFGLLAGCAATSPPIQLTGSHRVAPSENQGWRAIRFRMDRANGKTRWERDVLIAHRIVAPILMTHGQDIPLWRFHRRSAEDIAGHQFSFLFYTGAKEADLINRQIMADPLLARLMTNKLVRGVLIDGVEDDTRPAIGATSDPKWSPVMQVVWPFYIMGVSRMWLELINQISAEIGIADDASLDRVIDHYRTVNDDVSQIWQQEGYHALLHHLNAIYGYIPLVYWEKRIKTF
jgi:hypothetical protein